MNTQFTCIHYCPIGTVTFWNWDFVSFLIFKKLWIYVILNYTNGQWLTLRGGGLVTGSITNGVWVFYLSKKPSANGTFSPLVRARWRVQYLLCVCVNFFFFWLCFGSRGEGWEEGVVGREFKLVIFTSWAMDPGQLCYPLGLWMCV